MAQSTSRSTTKTSTQRQLNFRMLSIKVRGYSLAHSHRLVSAVNSAFVIDIQSELEPDPNERSATYLRAIFPVPPSPVGS